MKVKLNVIVVGYNEEVNIPKMFKHLEYLRSKVDCRIIYIDQESVDTSVELMKKGGAEVYIHKNQGYADPDKKWAVEELCNVGEWCFILDCDEEFNDHLVDTIQKIISDNEDGKCYSVLRRTDFLGKNIAQAWQLRFFKKGTVKLSLEVHNYINSADESIHIHLKEHIDEIDMKQKGAGVRVLISKNNNYSDKEQDKIKDMSKAKTVFMMIWMPILWFFGWGIVHKNFFRGWSGIIHCSLQAQYQFRKYAKKYEQIMLKNKR